MVEVPCQPWHAPRWGPCSVFPNPDYGGGRPPEEPHVRLDKLPRRVMDEVIQFERTRKGAAGYFARARLPGNGRVSGVAVGEDGFPQVLRRARGPGSFLRRIEQIARGRAWRPHGGREGGRPGLSAADELNRAALVGGGRSAGIRGGGGRGRAAGARLALG